ncbi:lipase family protein [Streptomyces sp. XM4193]|uniref:esterase/lipase family protein n=1 Tax=Streptomyces sp. XM4193 TaxID=2929782 RepID=UPI001FF7DFA0|nr:alpha/beta fold hydrolase [Streptomyces sp. XM4193]MCK1799078.1 lipase family protein [Streptomyces sp. XM4193]
MKLSRTRTRQLVAATALAVAVALVPAAGNAVSESGAPQERVGATVESDAVQKSASCTPTKEHPRPVVLVHGTFGNSKTNWTGLSAYLKNRGYCVHAMDYGQLPGVPIFHGLDRIEKSAAQLDDFVDQVLADSGATEVDIVGHSQGGMMPRHYLKFLGGAQKVNALVGIAPSSHGTTLSGLTRLLDLWPGAKEAIGDHTPALDQQVVGSDFLTELNRGGDTVPGVDYTVISSRYDLVVTPYETQYLEGERVRNVLLQDLCPSSLSGHVAIALTDRTAWHETANALDPANATPASCSS